jgi:hypothetical protein
MVSNFPNFESLKPFFSCQIEVRVRKETIYQSIELKIRLVFVTSFRALC